MEITPGVHRITDINGSNAVLIVDEQMAVVDTGISGNGESIVSYIKSIGRDPKDLRWILVTHFHFDHSGSAQELHELTGAKIVSHKAETELSDEGKSLLIKGNEGAEGPPKIYSFLMGRRGNRKSQEIKYHDTEVHETVEEDDVLPCLGGIRIMHTPGHTPGSICPVLEGPRVLFLGDSVLNNINRLSRPLMWDRNKRRELDTSLRRLREIDSDVAMFGHGPPLTDDVNNKVRGLTDRPYDLPTWKIVLKNWRTLRKWRETTSKPGHWGAGPK